MRLKAGSSRSLFFQVSSVEVRVLRWTLTHRSLVKKALLGGVLLCVATSVVYFGIVVRMGVKTAYQRKALGFMNQLSCHEVACLRYAKDLSSSLNQSIDPCESLYDFVCSGRGTSSVRAGAEERLYEQALKASLWSSATSANTSVAGKIGALVRSCLAISTSGMNELVIFLKERHLPWPHRPTLNLLSILVDLSVNWNINLWFDVIVPSSHRKNGSGTVPILEFRKSRQLLAWLKMLSELGHKPQYEDNIQQTLQLFGVSNSGTRRVVPTITAMDNLISTALTPAARREQSTRTVFSIENLSRQVTPGVPTASWILLLNQCVPWAGPFSAIDVVSIDNPQVLRATDSLLSFNPDIEDNLALSVGLRVIQEIGWMAHKDVGIALIDTARNTFTRRCQIQVEQMVGVAWFSLLSLPAGDNGLIKRIQRVLRESGLPSGQPQNSLKGPWDLPPLVLPDARKTFFGSWMAYCQLRWNLTKNRNIMRVNSNQDWTWESNVVVTPLVFSFPFFHKDLPGAINYAGAGRLLAYELLRERPERAQWKLTMDTRSLLAALTAYNQDRGTQRHS